MVGFRSIGGSSSLFITVLQALINVAPSRCVHTAEHVRRPGLLAFRDSENGVDVTVFPENLNFQGSWHVNEIQRLTIPGYKLSCDCGDFYFRCQDILVNTSIQGNGREINLIFIPLKNGVLFVSYWFDSNNTAVELDTSVMDIPDCNPTLFYSTNGKIYTICVNSTQQVITVYEIQKSQQMIENAVLVGPLANLSVPELSDSNSDLSRFVVQVSESGNKVFFAVKNIVFEMNVLNPMSTKQLPKSPECNQIHEISLEPAANDIGQQLLLAYCTDGYVYFNLAYGDWISTHRYSISGRPYLCPNKDYKVFLFNDTVSERNCLNFTVRGSNSSVICLENANSGICFEIENETYFVFTNQVHSMAFVFSFSSQSLRSLMSYKCSTVTTDCPQILLFDHHYLVVHDTGNVYVFDAKTDFSLVINTTGIPDTSLVTVIQVNYYNTTVSPQFSNSTTAVPPVSSHNFTTTTWPFNTNTTSKISIAVIVSGLLIVVILITIIVALSFRLVKKQGCITYRVPNTPRLVRFVTDHDQTLLPEEDLHDESVTRPSEDTDDTDDTEGNDNCEMQPLYSGHLRTGSQDPGQETGVKSIPHMLDWVL